MLALWLWLELRAHGARRRRRARLAAVSPAQPRCACTRCAADRAFRRVAA